MDSKVSIDNLLSSLNPIQKPRTRSQTNADSSSPQTSTNKFFEPTPLSSLLTEGMDQEQVWMQLDLRCQMVCDLLDYALETGKSEEDLSAAEEEDDATAFGGHECEQVERRSNVDIPGPNAPFDGEEGMEVDDGAKGGANSKKEQTPATIEGDEVEY